VTCINKRRLSLLTLTISALIIPYSILSEGFHYVVREHVQ